MNRIHTALAIVALGSVFVLWQLTVPSDNSPGSTASSAGDASEPLSAESTQPSEPQPTSTERSDRRSSDMQANVGNDCTWVTEYIPEFETGELIEAIKCEPNNPEPIDPYTTWDNQTLANMAYGDAHAAEVLGLRHIRSSDPNEEAIGLNLIFRSVALSGDLNTFRKAMGVRYAYMSINDEPQVDNMRRLMLFNVIGEVLGDERFDSRFIASELSHAGMSGSEIDDLRSTALNVLRSMASLQTEMTGDRWMQEALDNV